MSRLRIVGLLLAIAVLVAIAFLFGMHWAGRAAESPPVRAAQPQARAPGVVAVSPRAQEEAGLATAPVTATLLHPAANAYAVAMDVRPLLAARQQISTGQAQVHAAESAERASRAEYERARKLFADDRNVSQKALQAAEAAWQADRGKLEASTAALHESEAAAAQQFGAALMGDANAPSAQLRRIAAREQGLVEVMLPAATDAAPPVIDLVAPGYPASKAQRIGPAPRVDGAFAGRAFLYRTDTVYPAGLRLQADVPLAASTISGFVVPESAVVWYGNEPWVFVQAAPGRFARRALKNPRATAGGTFTTTGFANGDRIVVRGAQLLQSEALKPNTPATSGCSDPECDD